MQENLRRTDGEEPLQKANWLAQKIKYQQQIEKTSAEIERVAILKTFYSVIAALAIVLTALLFVIGKRKLKSRQDKYDNKVLTYELDKLKFEQKLAKASEDLHAQVLYMREKNLQVQQLQNEINNIKKSSSFYIEAESKQLQKLLESHLMTDENWINFKRQFIKEYPAWYNDLISGFPELSNPTIE